MSWVDGKSLSRVCGRIATKQFLNATLLATIRLYIVEYYSVSTIVLSITNMKFAPDHHTPQTLPPPSVLLPLKIRQASTSFEIQSTSAAPRSLVSWLPSLPWQSLVVLHGDVPSSPARHNVSDTPHSDYGCAGGKTNWIQHERSSASHTSQHMLHHPFEFMVSISSLH